MKKLITKIIVITMLMSMIVVPKTAFAAVTIDENLSNWGFKAYQGPNGLNADCSIVDSGEADHGEVLQIYSTNNPDRNNRYGGIQFDLDLQPGTYRIFADFRCVEQLGTDIGRQRFISLATSTHAAPWGDMVSNPSPSTEWGHKNYKITVNSAGTYKVQFGMAGNCIMYFDNIRVCNENNRNTDENFLPTGDFSPKKITTESGPEYFPGWTISSNEAATVERVYDEQTNNHYAKLTNLGTGSTYNKLYYQIPASKYDPTHSFTISAKVRTANYTNSSNWLALSWGGQDKTPWIEQDGMQKGWKTLQYTKDGGFTGKLGFGFTHAHACDLYIDDLAVYDNTTGSYLELENADFEKVSADYVQPANSVTMPCWTISTNEDATVERVYDVATDNHYAKLTNLGTGATFNKLYYQIPASKYDPTHSFTISAKVRTANYTNDQNWLALSWGGQDNTPWIEQNGMQKGWITVSYTKDGGFTGKLGFGFTHAPACDLYIDDLTVYDETTGAYIELENADFETTVDEAVTFTKNNGGEATAEIISKNETYDIYLAWATYAVDVDGKETLDNVSLEKKKITASDDVQSFTITPEIKAGYATKAFLWKADNLEPLAPALEFEAVELAE